MLRLTILWLIFCLPLTAFATPDEVLIFPGGAIVSETTTVSNANKQATLTLPAAADQSSLQLAVADSKTLITHFQLEEKTTDSTDVDELKKQIETLTIKRQRNSDILAASHSALDYWTRQQQQDLKDMDSIAALAATIEAKGLSLREKVSTINREQAEIKRQLQELEIQLKRTGRNNKVLVATLFFDQATAPLKINYSYRIHTASWQPQYSLNAKPQQRQIDWHWRAELYQSSGDDWPNIRIRLATREPRMTLTPPQVGRWIIRERPQFYRNAAPQPEMLKKSMVAMDSAVEMESAPQKDQVQRQEGFLFDIYDLGRHTVPAGQPLTLDIDSGSWPAEFDYLSRPLEAAEVFLRANVSLNDFVPLPQGQATLLVNGLLIGKRSFAMQSKEIELAFGNDPALSCTINREEIADKSGVFSKKKKKQWLWTIEYSNNKKVPLEVQVEDAVPQVQHKEIKMTPIARATEARRDKDRNIWTLSLLPGQTQTLRFGYELEYPAEMSIELGR